MSYLLMLLPAAFNRLEYLPWNIYHEIFTMEYLPWNIYITEITLRNNYITELPVFC